MATLPQSQHFYKSSTSMNVVLLITYCVTGSCCLKFLDTDLLDKLSLGNAIQ